MQGSLPLQYCPPLAADDAVFAVADGLNSSHQSFPLCALAAAPLIQPSQKLHGDHPDATILHAASGYYVLLGLCFLGPLSWPSLTTSKPALSRTASKAGAGIIVEPLFNAFATAAFFEFVIFAIFEMRYLLSIWRARRCFP